MTHTELLALKPSQLIRAALVDFEQVEQDTEHFKIDMCTWIEKSEDNPCYVCLAGAFLIKSLGFRKDGFMSNEKFLSDPYDYSYRLKGTPLVERELITHRLFAVNSFRSGHIHLGLQYMGILDYKIQDQFLAYMHTPSYEDYPLKFKEKLREFATMFEEKGL